MEEARERSPIDQDTERGIQYSPDSSVLPCVVCGEKSSGIHFGAMTCEACKVFFRRNVDRNSGYTCFGDGSCDITAESRSHCSYCRLQKCFKVGMSKTSSKRGRRSMVLKQDIKKMERKEKLKAEEEKKASGTSQQLIEETIERLKKLHDDFRLMTPEVMERIQWRKTQRQFYLNTLQEIGNPLRPEEVKEFYQETGIDLSGLMQQMLPCAQLCCKKYAMSFINYLKNLKEFNDLSLHDRVIIVRGCGLMWIFASAQEKWDVAASTVSCTFCGVCFSTVHMESFSTINKAYMFTESIKKLQEQNLTDDEIAIFRAFVVFDASLTADQELDEPEKISAVQSLFLDCLLCTLEENRGKENGTKTFTKLVDFMTHVRLVLYQRQSMFKAYQGYGYAIETKSPWVAGEVFGIPDQLVEDLGENLNSMTLD